MFHLYFPAVGNSRSLHPNIAKVFDAGVTQAGRPYFVIELVKGIPISALGRFEEAEPLLLSSVERLDAVPAVTPQQRRDARQRVAKFRASRNPPEKAAAWRADGK